MDMLVYKDIDILMYVLDEQVKECKEPQNMPVKCFNWGEVHLANYRGCMITRELQKKEKQF